jgi:hypothetical protein
MTRPLVCYMYVEDERYPRNKKIRGRLEDAGYEILIVPKKHAPPIAAHLYMFVQAVALMRRATKFEAVVLSEFSNFGFPYAWLLARRHKCPLVVDMFVGKAETIIGDWRRHGSKSLAARLLRVLDRATVSSADILLCDTSIRADTFSSLTAQPVQCVVISVGAPEWVQRSGLEKTGRVAESSIDVLFYGYYAALHNVAAIVDAMIIGVQRHEIASSVIVGQGTGRSDLEELVQRLGLSSHIQFLDNTNTVELRRLLDRSNICLGIFGGSDKAATVIPNKVWESVALGIPVVTRSSEAYADMPPEIRALIVEVDVTPAETLGSRIVEAITDARGRRVDQTVIASALHHLEVSQFDTLVETLRSARRG